MPQIATQYVDIPLTNYSIELNNADLISDTLAPVIPVDRDTGIYYEYGKEDFDVSGSDLRSPGAKAGLIDYKLSTHIYGPLWDHSKAMIVPVEEVKNAMRPIDPFNDRTRKLTRNAKLRKEYDLFGKLTDTSKITQNAAPSTPWSDFLTGGSGSHPIDDFTTAFDTLMAAIQKPRNQLTVVLGYPVFSVLIQHPDIIERYKYSKAAIMTAEDIRDVLQVKEVIVGSAVRQTSVEGITPVTQDYIWGKNAWVMYRENSPSLYTVSGCYTLNKPDIAGPWSIFRWFSTARNSDFLRISYYYQQYIMAPQAIYYIPTAIS